MMKYICSADWIKRATGMRAGLVPEKSLHMTLITAPLPTVQLISSLNQLSPSVLCTPFLLFFCSLHLLSNLQRRYCPKAFLANLALSHIRGTQAGGSREGCFNIAGDSGRHTSSGAAGRHSRLKSLWINDSLASEVFSNWCC